MKLWHPHTERPTDICSCLIAMPPEHEEDVWALASSLYTYNPRTNAFRCEETDIPLVESSFFWALELDVLAELEAPR